MNINNKVRVILAFVLSIIAVVLIYSFLSNSKDEVYIVVATKDIEKGVKLDESFVEVQAIPRSMKEQYFKDTVENEEEVIGCVTKQKILAGQPILANMETLSMGDELMLALTQEGKVNNSFFIPEDSRLITIEVDSAGSIYYSVKKGDFVDVIYSSVDESTGGLYSNLLLQHIEIFNVERITTEEGGIIAKMQNVTLIATPQECLKLVAGNRNGKLDLALNPLKGNSENIESVNILSFNANKPLTKEQKLDSLQGYIQNFEMSEGVREQVLLALDKERDIDVLIEVVNATTIDVGTKESILKLLNQER